MDDLVRRCQGNSEKVRESEGGNVKEISENVSSFLHVFDRKCTDVKLLLRPKDPCFVTISGCLADPGNILQSEQRYFGQ